MIIIQLQYLIYHISVLYLFVKFVMITDGFAFSYLCNFDKSSYLYTLI